MEKPWCKLISLSKNAQDIQITENIHKIGRKDRNNTSIKNTKISGTHCVLSREKQSDNTYIYYLEDLSLNGTFHNKKKLGTSIKTLLADGDEIMLLTKNQVNETGTL